MANERARNVMYGLAGAAASATGVLAAMGCGGGACASCPGCLSAGGVAAGLLVMRSVVRAVREAPDRTEVEKLGMPVVDPAPSE